MKPIVILSIFLFSVIRLSADENWELTNSPKAANNYGISVDSDGDLYTIVYVKGVLRSTDKGDTWKSANGIIENTDYRMYRNRLEINQSNNILLATDSVIYYTTDKGEEWTDATFNLAGLPLHNSYKQLYAIGDTFFLSISGVGFYKLLAGSDQWINFNGNIEPDFSIFHTFSIATDDSYYALISKYESERMIVRSSNKGINWDTLSSEYIQSFNLHPNGSFFINRSDSLFVTEDLNSNWTFLADGMIVWDINETGDIFAAKIGSYYTLWKSSDNGITWKEFHSNKFCHNYYAYAVDTDILTRDPSNNIYYISDRKSIIKSTDNGNTWERKTFNFNQYRIDAILPANDETVYVGNRFGLYKSTDRGQDYKLLFPQCTTYNWFYELIKIPGRGVAGTARHLYFSYDEQDADYIAKYPQQKGNGSLDYNSRGVIYSGRYFSTDFGETWEEIKTNLPHYGNRDYPSISGTYIDDSDNIIVGLYRGSIYKSTDGGSIFYEVGSKLIPYSSITYMAGNKNTLFAFIISQEESTSFRSKFYRSFDSGETWEIVENNLNGENNYSYALSRNGDLFVGEYGIDYSNGLLKSTDNGSTWEVIPLDIPDNNITAVAIDEKGHVWIGNESGDVYYSKTALTSNEPNSVIQDKDSYLNIYPNPASSHINMVFNSNEQGNAEITLTDLFGRNILFNKQLIHSGRNNIKIDIRTVENGAYFINLRLGNNSTFKPIIIQR